MTRDTVAFETPSRFAISRTFMSASRTLHESRFVCAHLRSARMAAGYNPKSEDFTENPRSYIFRRWQRRVRCIILLACASSLCAQSRPAPAPSRSGIAVADLRAGFANPPQAAKLRCYWWWLNGHTDKATITHDLEQMKAKGFGGVLLVDANGSDQGGNSNVQPGPTFGSAAWMELYRHALREADRLGLDVALNITSGWNLGGPDVTPAQASKLLTWSTIDVSGGKHLSLNLAEPPIHNGFYRRIAVLAYPLRSGAPVTARSPSLAYRTASAETGFSMPPSGWMLSVPNEPVDTPLERVRNITSRMQGDTLEWDIPAGEWEILRIGYTDSNARVSTSSGAWQGLAIDYLNRDAFDTYWDHTVAPLLQAARPFHSLKTLATDSWELGGTNWTDNFAVEFKSRRGYDPIPWLPVVTGRIVQSSAASTAFLADLRRTVADLIVSNHYDEFARRAAKAGLGVQAESGGPHGAPLDALETFRRSAVPQSEFWSQNPHRSKDEERFFTKEAASAVNIYGQKFVAQEGETSIGEPWSESLATDLKPTFDMAITEGMNRLVWHEFTSSPASTGLPGQEYFAGTHVNPKVTWWNAGDAFFRYLNRVQFMMQQGVPVDDVLYFYGDNIPAFVRLKADDPAHVLPGYDYDVTDQDALLHTLHAETGKLRGPSGMQWRMLVMPADGHVSLSALTQIAAYVKHGGTLAGTAPIGSTGQIPAEEQKDFTALKEKLWGASCAMGTHHAYGRGEVWCTKDTRSVLLAKGIPPDVEVDPASSVSLSAASTSSLDCVHRRTETADIYFFRNGSADPISTGVLLRVQGASVELWNAVTGKRYRADAQRQSDGRTHVQLSLPAFGSLFVIVSRKPEPALRSIPTVERDEPLKPIEPWSVSFQPDRGAPAHAVSFPSLSSWSENSDAGIRYFSGTAVYHAEVIAPQRSPGEQVWLHFNDIREIARVHVNGSDAGTVWAKPLAIRIDPWLKPGRNTLDIEVTNLWPNRIIGDLQPDARVRFTQTNIRSYRSDSPLLPSGLIGDIHWELRR